jgi:hypothetical protein
MAIQHANRGIVKKDLQLYYNREFSKSFRGEATTNLYGTYGVGAANAYPSAGNNWGTYRDSLYNGGAFASIGTIASVSSNIITVSSPTAYFNSFATFDVITPQTTGGGLTANTNYYFKRLSSTTFTLHQYDGTENASKTPEQVLTYINSDTRISVNATSFPTMWWGPPHVPNCALIKTAITNGFAYDNRLHDCLRLNWFRSDRSDGMAYGTTPNYLANTQYAFSAYVRATSQNAIGGTINISAYQSGTATYPNITGAISPVLTSNWQKWTGTFTSSATGGVIYFYFFPQTLTLPSTVDIAEMQLEQKSYATEFTPTSRSANTVAGGGGLLDMSGNVLNSDLTNAAFNSTGYVFSGSQYITVPYSSNLDRNDFTITGYCRTPTNDNSHDTIVSRNSDVYGTNGNGWNISRLRNGLSLANCFRFMIYGDSTTANEVQGPAIADNVWRHFAVVVDKSVSNTAVIYINGVLYSTLSSLPAGNHYPSSGSPPMYIGCNKTNSDLWNGDIAQILYYGKALTAAEVLQNYNATRKTYGI